MLERQIGSEVAQPWFAHDQQLLIRIGRVAADRSQVALLVATDVLGPRRRQLSREGALGGAARALPVAHREVRGVVYEKHGSTERLGARVRSGTECGTLRILILVLSLVKMALGPDGCR